MSMKTQSHFLPLIMPYGFVCAGVCVCVTCALKQCFLYEKAHQTAFLTTRSFIKQFVVSRFSQALPFSPAASVPFRRTEETAGARHRPHHPTSEQLVSHFRVYMQSIPRVCNPRLSKFLMIGINATTPPLFLSYTNTRTHMRTHTYTYRIILT